MSVAQAVTLGLIENLALTTTAKAQASFGKTLDSSEQFGIAGAWGLVWNGTCLSHSSKAFQRMRAITPSVSRG